MRSPREVVAAYHEAAGPKAVSDYGFHLILADPTPQALQEEIPQLVDEGRGLLQDLHDLRPGGVSTTASSLTSWKRRGAWARSPWSTPKTTT